jgi:DeoR/GlpR family transcriptional regulator of sugar metabolism
MSQTTRHRRDAILERVVARGHVSVKDVASDMSVSEATVRRDLRALADERHIDLVYGGATIRRSAEQSLEWRAQQNIEAKRVIGKIAADLVHDGDLLFIDAGSTCFEMRHYLPTKRELSVIVHSTNLALELGKNLGVTIIMLGGHYRPDRMDSVGPLSVNAIDQLRGYVAFIGADGLSMDFGLSASDIQTAHLYQHVMKNARESILLVDHTKFLAPSLFRICDIDAVTTVVTDCEPPAGWDEYLGARGIELIFPSILKEPPYA